MLNVLILIVVAATGFLLARPALARKDWWRATMTPLASIIGSGFLVLGPVLSHAYGLWAPAMMALLCVVAWLFGMAIRRNIADLADGEDQRGRAERGLDAAASWALVGAYFIAVAYYLNLFGSFAVNLTPWNDPVHARIVTTAVFLVILLVGWTWGFKALERMEQVSVGIKLAIIAGLLAGLAWFFAGRVSAGELTLTPVHVGWWEGTTLAFGLIVTVQGFETSRYLGRTYDAATRIRSMRLAQMLSAAIYMVYVVLLAWSLGGEMPEVDEAAIIDMMRVVAAVLPVLLVAAALSAQFSAAVADTSGAGGLMHELTGGKLGPRLSYVVLVGLGLVMTWTFNVFEIIAHASRAFALYYGVQALIAGIAARRDGQGGRAVGWFGLAVLGATMAVLGAPVE
ncbi:hypothetical protein [Pelagovum pacificum]|uniref:APC family permease n=1 Tax=Pelagovum pacificum TaxID=2588711 RepID=A0A5C5GAC4_9RHOB|nr:hypothetical protein [Pelagovum pacificum]QQA41680.1 hypothetical protein I8N54_12755 [Pelagovum pacificum]TNY30958.1 hypothetical protein FHY64_17825 [Pelagovum pacificum]